MAISDDSTAIVNAATAAWGTATTFRWCEYHLREQLRERVRRDGIPRRYSDATDTALRTVFYSISEFETARDLLSRRKMAARWFQRWEPKLVPLIAARSQLPTHYSNGAAEAVVRSVREFIGNRAFCFRNAERTNRLHNRGRAGQPASATPTTAATVQW